MSPGAAERRMSLAGSAPRRVSLDAVKLLPEMQREPRPAPARLLRTLATQGALYTHEIEDWFYDTGHFFVAWFAPIAELAGWEPRADWPFWFTGRPSRGGAWGFQGLGAAVFVAGLLDLHRFGIDAAVRAAVDVTRAPLVRRRRLDSDELSIVWAPRELGRMRGIARLAAPATEERLPDGMPRVITTRTGYVVRINEPLGGVIVVTSELDRTRRRKDV